MRFTEQSRPPGKQMPAFSFKQSQRRKTWSLPRCLMELPPEVPSTSFQSRVLLASFSWKDSHKKQGRFFFVPKKKKKSCFPTLRLVHKKAVDFGGGRFCCWPPYRKLASAWLVCFSSEGFSVCKHVIANKRLTSSFAVEP